MKFTSFLQKRMVNLLNDRRIVVWYDNEGDFRTFAASFHAPNCEVLSAGTSVLQARRRADEIYRRMNESDNPAERERCMLIYIPRRRGDSEEAKMRDPFEVYAVAGAAFGGAEDQKMESLARQAMPEKAEEITRLFHEGKPDIALLDNLEKTQHWPLLNEVFHTETPADIIASALGDEDKAEAVDGKPGCTAELLRMLESAVGFKPASAARKWKTIRSKAAEFILFSEFIFDLPNPPPDSLEAVPRAGADCKSVVFAICDRMRADADLNDAYMDLARKVEGGLHLPELMPKDFDPGERDTFPFEERRMLAWTVELTAAGDQAAARIIIEKRKRSIWRHDPLRSPAWTAVERASALIDSADAAGKGSCTGKSPADLVKAYTEGGISDLDRTFRLFETALTACTDEDIIAPVVALCRKRYRDAVTNLQDVFLKAVQTVGWPPEGVPRQTRIFDEYIAPHLERREKTAFFMVDSLRYEMGRDLSEVLAETGEVEIHHAACVIPTITDCGMAALLPGADGALRFVGTESGLTPALGSRQLKTSEDRMKYLAGIFGDRVFETTLDALKSSPKKAAAGMKNADLFIVRTQDPDLIGEKLGSWQAKRYISDTIGDIASAVRWTVAQGFNRVVISADHGHMMLPEILAGDVVKSPPGDWPISKRRCLLGAGVSLAAGTVTIKAGHLGIQGDVQDVCLPVGFRVFTDGDGYFHGGLSLQEAVVPVVVFKAGGGEHVEEGKPVIDIQYRADKFTGRVIGLVFRVQRGMFATAARVRIEAYDGSGMKAGLVGEAADCEARDEKTHEVTLTADKETPVPVLLSPDFDGPEVEIRVSDPQTRVVWAKRKLKNAMLD
jgi:hypothetical protein